MNSFQKIMRVAYAAILMIMIFTRPAFAASWVYITSSDDNCEISVDSNSIDRKGDVVQCWVLFDYKKAGHLPDKKEFYSSQFLYEIDRSKREIKILSNYSFSENRGTGLIVCSGNEDLWPTIKIPPGSAAESIMNYVFKASRNTTK